MDWISMDHPWNSIDYPWQCVHGPQISINIKKSLDNPLTDISGYQISKICKDPPSIHRYLRIIHALPDISIDHLWISMVSPKGISMDPRTYEYPFSIAVNGAARPNFGRAPGCMLYETFLFPCTLHALFACCLLPSCLTN